LSNLFLLFSLYWGNCFGNTTTLQTDIFLEIRGLYSLGLTIFCYLLAVESLVQGRQRVQSWSYSSWLPSQVNIHG